MKLVRHAVAPALAAMLLGFVTPASADSVGLGFGPGGVYFDYHAGYGHYRHFRHGWYPRRYYYYWYPYPVRPRYWHRQGYGYYGYWYSPPVRRFYGRERYHRGYWGHSRYHHRRGGDRGRGWRH